MTDTILQLNEGQAALKGEVFPWHAPDFNVGGRTGTACSRKQQLQGQCASPAQIVKLLCTTGTSTRRGTGGTCNTLRYWWNPSPSHPLWLTDRVVFFPPEILRKLTKLAIGWRIVLPQDIALLVYKASNTPHV